MVPSIQAATLWGGLLILLLLVLSSVVVSRRRRHLIEFGDGGNPEMTPAVRAFGNAAEYIPAGICGLILLAFVGAPPLLIHGVGAGLHRGGDQIMEDVGGGRLIGHAPIWRTRPRIATRRLRSPTRRSG